MHSYIFVAFMLLAAVGPAVSVPTPAPPAVSLGIPSATSTGTISRRSNNGDKSLPLLTEDIEQNFDSWSKHVNLAQSLTFESTTSKVDPEKSQSHEAPSTTTPAASTSNQAFPFLHQPDKEQLMKHILAQQDHAAVQKTLAELKKKQRQVRNRGSYKKRLADAVQECYSASQE
ncbi:hypothetical protein BC835DRAFT_1304074 [Cytidiella melzeri]|nr:hypothetical protein BC835DRAFT_1304074 [Cytidiella melzeri]